MTAVLITGVRGKTGRQVATALLRRGVVTVPGGGRSVADLSVPGVIGKRFDWEDPTSWPEALAGIEGCVSCQTEDP